MDTKATPLSSPAQWIAERRRVADDAIVAYMCHHAAASTATVCGIAADDAWDRAQAVLDTAVTAIHAAHPYTIAAELGAHTAADYLQENHAMPTQPESIRGGQWIQLWAPDYSCVIWDARTAVEPGEDQFDAAKQFMAFLEYSDLPMTVHSDTWTNRWSGRLIRHGDDDYRIDGTHEFLRYLAVPPNPFFEVEQ